jgi:hypothetical protein
MPGDGHPSHGPLPRRRNGIGAADAQLTEEAISDSADFRLKSIVGLGDDHLQQHLEVFAPLADWNLISPLIVCVAIAGAHLRNVQPWTVGQYPHQGIVVLEQMVKRVEAAYFSQCSRTVQRVTQK